MQVRMNQRDEDTWVTSSRSPEHRPHLCVLFHEVCFCFGGSKHKTMLEARSGAGPIKAYPRPGAKLKSLSSSVLKGSGLQNKTFHCQICDVHVNSEIQLKQVEASLH